MKNLAAAGFMTLLVAALAGCGGGSSTGSPSTVPGAHTISSGAYQYNITSAPVNTCWAAPKTVLTLPKQEKMTGTVSGDTVTFVATSAGTGGVTLPDVVLTRTDKSLAGITDTDADLHSQGIDCVLHIHAVNSGTLTADDAFDSKNDITVSEKSGTLCGVLVGTTSPQFDALPCNLVLQGPVSKQ